jgi:hypothetical protein
LGTISMLGLLVLLGRMCRPIRVATYMSAVFVLVIAASRLGICVVT